MRKQYRYLTINENEYVKDIKISDTKYENDHKYLIIEIEINDV